MTATPLATDTVLMKGMQKLSTLIILLAFAAALFYLVNIISLLVASPQPVAADDKSNTVSWQQYKYLVVEQFDIDVIAKNSSQIQSSEVQELITSFDQLTPADDDRSAAILSFILHHPQFMADMADLELLTNKKDEYSNWFLELAESGLEQTQLVQWLDEMLIDEDFNNYVYSLSLSGDELELGDVEQAIDNAIFVFLEQAENRDNSLIDQQQQFVDMVDEHDYLITESIENMSKSLLLLGLFLIVSLLFRIESKMAVVAK